MTPYRSGRFTSGRHRTVLKIELVDVLSVENERFAQEDIVAFDGEFAEGSSCEFRV